jgi:hypothetical protein
MEGAVDGVLRRDGKEVITLQRDSGEGEAIWDDLVNYGRELEREGKLASGIVDKIADSKESLKCGLLYRAIYKALDEREAKFDDEIYVKMGEFTNRYVGKRSPLSQLMRMRALLGRKTTIVATPEVVKDTPYEFLAA